MSQIDRVFIAEKPNMAADIASAIGVLTGHTPKKSSAEGCWLVGEDRVAWLYGHCYDSAPPEQYNPIWKNRGLENLPIVVKMAEWQININRPPPPKDGRPPLNYEATVRKVASLCRQARTIVGAGDAEREGQLLVDELLKKQGFDPWGSNVLRLWCSSLSQKDLISSLQSMKPNKDYYLIYLEALCRQIADWLYGLNESRLYTDLAKRQGFDINIRNGRVMTPILGLVVRRDIERANFRPIRYFGVTARFQHQNGQFTVKWLPSKASPYLAESGRVLDAKIPQQILEKISGREGKIATYQKVRKKTPQPLPFSLAKLQILCSRRFQMSADETLSVAIKLYDNLKIATYPRSSSQHFRHAMAADVVPEALTALRGLTAFKGAADSADFAIRSPAWNDAKVSDHHGIIPTGNITNEIYNSLAPDEKKVFDVIAQRFLCQFYPPAEHDATSLTVLCEGETFSGNGSVPVSPGWKVLAGAEDDADEDEDGGDKDTSIFPPMTSGDVVTGVSGTPTSGETKKPAEFTDATLLEACLSPHLHEPDAALKKKLKDGGYIIGTEATRAAIFLKLLGMVKVGDKTKVVDENPYMQRSAKGKITSTELGRSLICSYPQEEYSLGMTALWEAALGAIRKGQIQPQVFLDKLMETIRKRISEAPNIRMNLKGLHVIQPLPGAGEKCPECHSGTLITREYVPTGKRTPERYLTCSLRKKEGGCNFVKWPDKPKTAPIAGDGEKCPKCKQGHLVTCEIHKAGPNKGKNFLACSVRECDFTRWPEIPPLPGTGQPCPVCKKGLVVTRERKRREGERTSADRRFQCCSIRECKFVKSQDKPGRK
ncbi:DNA topoisomerase I [Acetobacter malorum DSM 14337]|uniref:DNA topoisomerase n=1 Tax=Acetobacter malorum DSM 14337 TaxID=1307910 RepID=A0ABQ0Q0B5_9PROT|nr:DNA topoisomerase [Acetobacter malorum]KXV05786.1 hypothetical protein AD930_11745 [Acetobacter malorum]GBQ85975.1 DNA topoisomerase I [Acetobacter malorum DSM 14337]